MKKLMSGFLMALLGGVVSLGLYRYSEPKIVSAPENEKNNTNLASLRSSEPDLAIDYVSAAELTVNGVVHVKTEGMMEYNQRSFDPIRQFFYGDGSYNQKYLQPVKGAGSGVIISPDGYVVTNNHVIEKADKITVTLNDKKTYEAELIGTDPTSDLALLKIDEDQLPYINYGNSDDLRIGEWVLAVGNPFNLTSTVTAGIVSAKARDIDILGNDPITGLSSLESFIQTDAAVNPGNSGGALVNTKGELIGINAAIKSNTGSFAGYSFAIPSNIVKKVIGDIKEYGTVQRAFIGINIQNITEELADEHKLKDLNGVYINGLLDKGSAKKAGIKEGDVVKSIGGFNVNSVTELQAKIGEYRPGDEIAVGIIRDGESIEKKIILKNLEGNTSIIKNTDNRLQKVLGAKFSTIDKELMEKLEIEGGAQVEALIPGKFKKAGIAEDFIVTAVDNESIKSPEDLLETLASKKGGVLLHGIYPNGREAYYGLGL